MGTGLSMWDIEHIFFQKFDKNLEKHKEKLYQTLGERNGPEACPIHHDLCMTEPLHDCQLISPTY